jgi:hypothetical protein
LGDFFESSSGTVTNLAPFLFNNERLHLEHLASEAMVVGIAIVVEGRLGCGVGVGVVRKGVLSSTSSTFTGLSSSGLVGGLNRSEGGVEGPEVDVQSEKSDPSSGVDKNTSGSRNEPTDAIVLRSGVCIAFLLGLGVERSSEESNSRSCWGWGGWKRLTEDMVRKGAIEELQGSGNERNLESMSILAGGETILSRLISRGTLIDNVASLLMTGIRDGGVCGNGDGGCGEVVGEGEGRAELRNRCFISSMASSVVFFGLGEESEGLEKIFGLGFASSRFVWRSGVLKLS